MRFRFREKNLTPWGWLVHTVIGFRPRMHLIRAEHQIVGVLLPRPVAQFGKSWGDWRILKWR
jgi:hypothetical protein